MKALVIAFVALLTASIGNAALAETLLQRGTYLVTTVGACGNCHTPRGPDGKPMANMSLAGGFEFDDGEIGHVIPPNITPDRDTGIGKWTEAQIVAALRDGKRPDGTIIGPPMPIPSYRGLSDQDALAIAVYLKSLKPLHHTVARTQFKVSLPPDYGPPVTHVEASARSDKVAYGGYLAGAVGHCVLCHTPEGGGGPFDMSRAYQGGRELPNFEKPGEFTVSRNITDDPEHGLGKWSDSDIQKAIVTGIRPDGTKLVRTMAFAWYAKISPDDLDDIVAYLRSLKPAAH
jgi:mono/diheme cytochrome c family protein